MKKVGIVTLTGYFNYGQKFQNYAVQKILRDFGYDADTFISGTPDKFYLLGKKIRRILLYKPDKIFHSFFNNLKVLKKFHKKTEVLGSIDNREDRIKKFKDFSDAELKELFLKRKDFSKIKKNYDFVIIGSDQIWNPFSVYSNKELFDFLALIERRRRIALSPSVNSNKISFYDKKNYKKNIFNVKFLSTREYEGAKVIKKVTGRNAEVLADPTLAVKKEDWIKLSTKVKNKPPKYLLTYVLYNDSKELRIKIKQLSEKYNLPVINIMDYSDFKKYDIGPAEFINLIKDSSLMVTDSFHGTIFSMIFSVPPIIVGEGVSENSRFKTLNRKFGIESRFLKNLKESEIFDMDFKEINKKIIKERKKTHDFLKKALDIKDVSKTKK